MAPRVRAPSPSEDDCVSGAQYEVESISAHRRKPAGTGPLEYLVKWLGYPSEEGHDTWEEEENCEGAKAKVNNYWKNVPASKKHERYLSSGSANGSAQDKKSKAPVSTTSARGTPAASTSASRKRGFAESVEQEEVGSGSRRKSGAGNGTTTNASTRLTRRASSPRGINGTKKIATTSTKKQPASKRSRVESPELVSPARKSAATKTKKKAQAKVKKAISPSPALSEEAAAEEDEEDEEEDEEGDEEVEVEVEVEEEEQGETITSRQGYQVEGKEYRPNNERNFEADASWENRVRSIDTIEKGVGGSFNLCVVWAEDNCYSWVRSEVARPRCPQKILDFYETHLRFNNSTATTDTQEEEDRTAETNTQEEEEQVVEQVQGQ